MEIYEITTISVYRHKYLIEARSEEEACSLVLEDHPEELSQLHLEEVVTSKKRIKIEDLPDILDRTKQESIDRGGIDNTHLGTKIVYRTKKPKA